MKKNNLQLIIVLLFASCVEFSEQQTITSSYLTPDPDYVSYDRVERLDSLIFLEQIAPDDTGKVWLLINTGIEYRNFRTPGDMETAKLYFSRSLALSEKLKYRRGSYRSRMENAVTLFQQDNDSALVCYQEILDMAILDNDEMWISTARYNIGNVYYYDRRDYTKALEYYLLALPHAEQTGNPENIARRFCLIQMVYFMLEIPEKGIEYGEKALELLSDTPDHVLRRPILEELSRNFTLLNPRNFEKELELLNEALRLALLHGGDTSLETATLYQTFSNYYYDLESYEKSKEYALKALEIDSKLESEVGISGDMLFVAQSEFALRNIREANKWALEGYVIAKDHEFLGTQMDLTKILSEISLYNRDFDDYYLFLNENDSIKKIIDKEKQSQIVQELETKYEAEKKELEIEQQQQIISRQNMQRRALAVVVALCIVILAMLWYMLRLRNRRNRTLVEINLTKDKFFNIISHDLKNPAISQRDVLKILVKNACSWDAETLADYHGELLKSAEGQVELILNLLNWSKLQTGRMTCTPETFTVSDILPDLTLIRKMAENKNIAFTVQIPENTLITADSNILATVIRNLLTNAVKFTPSGGQVMLLVEVTVNSIYTFTVSDTGIGMSKEQINNLFRIDSTHSQRGTAGEQGSGLGLIVCRELLEKQGATLLVESEEEKGSKFSFKLKMLR